MNPVLDSILAILALGVLISVAAGVAVDWYLSITGRITLSQLAKRLWSAHR